MHSHFNCILIGNQIGQGASPSDDLGAGAYGGTLTKCTLTANVAHISTGGGAAYAILNDCLLSTNYGSGAYQCTLNDCILQANSAGANAGQAGGGALQCTLNNCSLEYNFAYYGGGAAGSTLNNCRLENNRVDNNGGGSSGGTLNNCTLTGNMAEKSGGGAAGSTLNNCTIADNYAGDNGGGTTGGTLNNCILIHNAAIGYPGAYGFGGGAYGGTLNNCTVTGNHTMNETGGGASGAKLNDCIVYFNDAPQDPNCDSSCTLNYSCTTPMPATGIGNFTDDPLFVDLDNGDLRLQSGSPCINAGNNTYVTNNIDLDGHPRILGGTVDVGAFEVVLPAHLFSSRLVGSNYCFSFDTESNRTYTIEYKNLLTDPQWYSYAPIIGNGQMLTITNLVSSTPQRFYRLRAD